MTDTPAPVAARPEVCAPGGPSGDESAAEHPALRLSVVGTGYLGATHAACMAELGFEVLGVDVDPAKIERLARGEVPFHEPGLPELLRRHVDSGRLRFTTDITEAARWADVHFIGVGTPQRVGESAADLTYVDAAVESLAAAVDRDALIVGKSTVPVGTARRLTDRVVGIRAAAGLPGTVELAWNPEFLREGFAVKDTLTPDRLVVGVGSAHAEQVLRRVYAAPLAAGTPWIGTDLETAELVKVAANAFLATKISFINAFSEITETVGGDIGTLADAIGLDARIGRRFLNAGVGFGGGCLPKDIRALQARVCELGLDRTMRFLAEVDDINLRRRDRVVDLTVRMLTDARRRAAGTLGEALAGPGVLNGARVAVLGVSFKPDSDDVRDSPALDVANRLYSAGAEVRVYDPEASENAAARFPRLDYRGSLASALEGAQVVLLLTEWEQFRRMDPEETGALVASRLIVDGRNVLDRQRWVEAGWTLVGLGHRYDAGTLTSG